MPSSASCPRPTFHHARPVGKRVADLLLLQPQGQGPGGWSHELVTAPFGAHPVLWPINLLMQIIEYIAKTVSHGMRLFGNMFAGELVFMLIALMGGVWAWQFNPSPAGSGWVSGT